MYLHVKCKRAWVIHENEHALHTFLALDTGYLRVDGVDELAREDEEASGGGEYVGDEQQLGPMLPAEMI